MTTLTAEHVDSRRLACALRDVLEAVDAPTAKGLSPPVGAAMHRLLNPGDRLVDLSDCVTRVATRLSMDMPPVAEMMSSIAETWVEPHLARGLAALVGELIRTVAVTVHPAVARIYVACGWDGDNLVLAIASPEAAALPVPSAAASRSHLRAHRLARAMQGDLVRGIKGGMMLYGATFAWKEGPHPGTLLSDRS